MGEFQAAKLLSQEIGIKNLKAILAICGVFLGCCSNIYFLELIIRYDKGAGNLATFCLYVLISFEGFINTRRCWTKEIRIPVREYATLTILYFLANTTSNFSFKYNVPMLIALIFRSGSLVANMVLGMIFLHKRYDNVKYISVFSVTFGVILCTLASSSAKKKPQADVIPSHDEHALESDENSQWRWFIGIVFLVISLFLTAAVGIFQEFMFKKYGKHPREALFFTHFLPLPGFLLLWTELSTHISIASASEKVEIVGQDVPLLWVFIFANMSFQFICINSVFVLTSECTSLTVTLVLTLRKFLSILISAVAFDVQFTRTHFAGTFLIFIGTLLYDNPWRRQPQQQTGGSQKAQKA